MIHHINLLYLCINASPSSVPYDEDIDGQNYQSRWFKMEVDEGTDCNPFLDVINDARSLVGDCKKLADEFYLAIESLPNGEDEFFVECKGEAHRVSDLVERVEAFDFTTDDMSLTFHGERLWEEVVTRTHGLRKAVARILEDKAWLAGLPDEFVTYICGVEENIVKTLNDWDRILSESPIWILMNYFRPHNPFYFRAPDGHYYVQKYSWCLKSIDFGSIGLYFMVRLYVY
jgi:hypothetical protein